MAVLTAVWPVARISERVNSSPRVDARLAPVPAWQAPPRVYSPYRRRLRSMAFPLVAANARPQRRGLLRR